LSRILGYFAFYPHPQPFSRLDHKTHLRAWSQHQEKGDSVFYTYSSRFCPSPASGRGWRGAPGEGFRQVDDLAIRIRHRFFSFLEVQEPLVDQHMVFVGCAPRTVASMVVRKAHPTQLLLSCDNPLAPNVPIVLPMVRPKHPLHRAILHETQQT
jgi:hypothetical protein